METAMDQDTIISLRNVCKGYRSKKGIRRILDDVSFEFRGGENLAILGGNGSGKSVLLRMICGMELPDSGTVQRAVSVSYPLGFAGGISSNMTGRDNVRFIARIYGCDVPDVERFVYDFSELGRSFDLPVVTYANSMRARLSYGISMALRCDVYVVDEMAAVGDVNFKRKCLEVFAERSRGATIIMAANAPTTVRRFCSHGVIMQQGAMTHYGPLDETIARYTQSAPAPAAEAEPVVDTVDAEQS
ncbi:ABC transporter ATP-binding protein [Bordetella bronchiseptica]|uniref:ABC transporter ATP-binding protein n=1 Tax=Bordetella bronchiseptica TaxID=518 RepID=UPI00052916B3|nr:ABC transporter ATP-binding protein [Bordetella bronchiseptica]QET72208.1 ABC transporter ATP-binding protein [Bordetella bronchiseptica]RSC00699.1 ABC transporter ATP-binding protein [Bordetella bronchiseptica]RSC05299.1 ABC transporter ATP-binding protein [Bordetella bronchiseptica]